jgi:hypothetical protein
MLRWCYLRLLRLHPRPFRLRFADEMLAIFDEVAARQSVRGQCVRELFADVIASLFRQWVLRSEFLEALPDRSVPSGPAGAPVFSSLDSYKLPTAVALNGGMVSLAVLCALAFAIVSGGGHPSWLIGAHRPGGDLLPVSRASVAETEPSTLVRVGPDPENPWRALAAVYFKVIRVLGALDANQDFVISPWEIVTAPSALRKLDLDHNGKLSPEECGFSLGASSANGPDAEFVRRVRMEFMRSHPVLAALDTDHDGEISAAEIMNSSRSLRKLDANGDGFLTPDEVMPDRAANQAAFILLRLDADRDGSISIRERESEDAAPLRGIIESADRNRDGVTTRAELTRELRIREENKREIDSALKAAHTGP